MKHFIILVFLLGCGQTMVVTPPLRSDLLGEYERGGEGFPSLELQPSGYFIQSEIYANCTDESSKGTRFRGRFQLDTNSITLYPESVIFLSSGRKGEKQYDSLPYQQNEHPYINRQYFAVSWGGVKMLVSSDKYNSLGTPGNSQIVHLANFLNAADYKQDELFHPTSYFFTYKEEAVFNGKQKFDVSQLPNEYRGWFLDEPIALKSIGMEKEISGPDIIIFCPYKYRLNKGRKHGVREGMSFYGPSIHCDVSIVSVEDSISYGASDVFDSLLSQKHEPICPVGTVLSTQFVRKERP